MQTLVSIIYYLMAAYFGLVMVWNLVKTRDIQMVLLYLVVLMPFVMRVLRLK